MFSAKEDILQEDIDQDKQDKDGGKKFTPVAFHEECVDRIEEHLAQNLIKRSGATFISPAESVALTCVVSKEHSRPPRPSYWFAFHPHLRSPPAVSSVEPQDEDDTPASYWTMPLEELRHRALVSGSGGSGGGGSSGGGGRRTTTATYRRNQAVSTYVLCRADGTCEGCGEPAPFNKRASGQPHLEPHHLRRRGDADPDHPRWVIALCPNCHCRVHYGKGGKDDN